MNMRTLALMLVVPAVTAAKAQSERRITVDELFQLVESNSKTLQQQKISVEFAQRGVEAARSERLPDIDAALSASYNGNVVVMDRDFKGAQGFSSPHIGNSFALEAQQVVYAGGAIDAGVRMAELEHDMAVAGQRHISNSQRFLALGQYLDLYKIANRMQVYEQNIALTEHLIADIKAKQEQGMALRNDVTRYELQMETLRLGLRKLQDQRAIFNYQLCNTLGLPQETVLLPDTTLWANLGFQTLVQEQAEPDNHSSLWRKEGVSEDDWQALTLTNSPQVEQAQIGTQIAQQKLRLAKSELLPKVALVAADNLSGPFTYDLPPVDKNINFWYVGVGLKYPLSSLYKQRNRVKQAEVGISRSRQQQTVVAEQLNNQMQQAWTLYEQSYVDLDTQRKSVQLAQQNYQVVSDRYLSQLALITDMLDASSIRLNAELQEVDALINIVYAYYKLKFIAGTL